MQAHDPDTNEQIEVAVRGNMRGFAPIEIEKAIATEQQKLIDDAVAVFNSPDLRDFIVDIRK